MIFAYLKRTLSAKSYARLCRLVLNLWPCIRGTGGKIIYIAPDFSELTVKLTLNRRTYNRVGTIFGGSMYASTDPVYMIMLMEILGSDFVVWDKGCTIRFKRPARVPLFAHFKITPEMLQDVRTNVARTHEYSFTWKADYRDQNGTVYCEFEKVLYVAEKEFYKDKQLRRSQAQS